MTRMLVGLADAEDAAIAAAGGVDVVEVRMVAAGGAGPDPAAIRAIRTAFPGTLRLRLDAPLSPGGPEAAVAARAPTRSRCRTRPSAKPPRCSGRWSRSRAP